MPKDTAERRVVIDMGSNSFRLVVYDAKSHFLLWAFTQSVAVAILQKTHDRNFDDALNNLLLDFEATAKSKP